MDETSISAPRSMGADGVSLFVAEAVEAEFIDNRDAAEFTAWAGRWFQRAGVLDGGELPLVLALSKTPNQRRLVEEYARFATTTNSPSRRSGKLAELGVRASTMTHWARRFFGNGYLARCAPTSASEMVRRYLTNHQGATRQGIIAHAGIAHTSLPGVLGYGLKHGTLRRDREGRGLWRWYVNG